MNLSRPGDVRERIWATLMRSREAIYPLPCHGHHPNFRSAGRAAKRLASQLFRSGMIAVGEAVLSFPDYVLKPVRRELLERGVNVVVPAKYGGGYRWLRSGKVDAAKVSSIAGAEREGDAISELPTVRMTVVACVALDRKGRYLTKGYGFRPPDETVHLDAATIVHPLQLVDTLREHDGSVEIFATPGKVVDLSESPARRVVV